jgi:hypothetical protein
MNIEDTRGTQRNAKEEQKKANESKKLQLANVPEKAKLATDDHEQ